MVVTLLTVARLQYYDISTTCAIWREILRNVIPVFVSTVFATGEKCIKLIKREKCIRYL